MGVAFRVRRVLTTKLIFRFDFFYLLHRTGLSQFLLRSDDAVQAIFHLDAVRAALPRCAEPHCAVYLPGHLRALSDEFWQVRRAS